MAENDKMLKELEFLREKLQDSRNIISAQQNYARKIPFKEYVNLAALVTEVLVMHNPSIAKHHIHLEQDFEVLPPANLERLKLVQILDNVIKNAVESMKWQELPTRLLTMQIRRNGPDRVRIVVSDTCRGIARKTLHKRFNYGFTTKRHGNGFGRHSAANAIEEMGGIITVTR